MASPRRSSRTPNTRRSHHSPPVRYHSPPKVKSRKISAAAPPALTYRHEIDVHFARMSKRIVVLASRHLSNDNLTSMYKTWFCGDDELCDPHRRGFFYDVVSKMKDGVLQIRVIYRDKGVSRAPPTHMNNFPRYMVHKDGALQPWHEKHAARIIMSVKKYPTQLPKDIREKISRMVMTGRGRLSRRRSTRSPRRR